MVQNVIKWAIAGSLFAGAILAFFNFIGNLAKDFLLKRMGNLTKENQFIFGSIFFWGFLALIVLCIILSIVILKYPTDFHKFFPSG